MTKRELAKLNAEVENYKAQTRKIIDNLARMGIHITLPERPPALEMWIPADDEKIQ